MRKLVKRPTVIIWIIFLLLSLLLLATKGLHYGVDFSGGTSFQIVLEEPATSDELERAASVVSKRLDWSGSKDAKVTPAGSQYLSAQLAESDPKEIAKLKTVLLKQGRFEAILDGNLLFSGDDIRTIYKSSSKGYGVRLADRENKIYSWSLPFLLSPAGADRFAKMTFHKCTPIGYGSDSDNYDCEKTYFFIDRPLNSIFVIDKSLYLDEKQVPVSPESLSSQYISIDDILDQVNSPSYVVDENLTKDQISKLKEDTNMYTKAIVASTVSKDIIDKLKDIGYNVIIVDKPENSPWIWAATGLKSIVSITPGIANMDAPTVDSSNFQRFSQLNITGSASGLKAAKDRLNNILLVLESGSLPVPIKSISTESISPYLGSEFLDNALLIALLSIITVAIVLFFRYRLIKLSLPILLMSTSEIIILLGILSLINFRLDLAGVAGILATIGTGVDHQVIITDQLLKGKKSGEVHSDSLKSKVKKAFFIVFAAAATTTATMLPIIFLGSGLSKLVGFAVTIILGTLVGVFITRPTFAEIAKRIVSSNVSHKKE